MVHQIIEIAFVISIVIFGSFIIFSLSQEAILKKEKVSEQSLVAKLLLKFLEDSGINDDIRYCIATDVQTYCDYAKNNITKYFSKLNYNWHVYTSDGRIDINKNCNNGVKASGYLFNNIYIYVEVCY